MQSTAIRTGNGRHWLKPGWQLSFLFIGFPLWWFLGLAGFIWPVASLFMLASLVRRKRVVAPKGFSIWAAFMLWMLFTGIMIDNAGRAVGFAYRGVIYVSATVALLYIYNASMDGLPMEKVVGILSIFWTYVVIGGYLGLLFPSTAFTSPMERILPGFLLANDFVREMVHPGFAQVMHVLGYDAPRPSAPFVYTNDWGGNFALLVPIVLIAVGSGISVRLKTWLVAMGAISVVPVILSLNRGLWLSLAMGMLYAAVLLFLRGRAKPLIGIVALMLIVVGALFLTPLRDVFDSRLDNPHSNERRVSLFEEAVEGTVNSPIFGYGAPRPSAWNPDAPSVGTQGALWLILFSHGIPGLLLFLGWFGMCWWRLVRSTTPLGFWISVMLVILVVQLPVYGVLPAQIHIVMIGIALAMRERSLTSAGALQVDADGPAPIRDRVMV
jgi:O-antigen ligase